MRAASSWIVAPILLSVVSACVVDDGVLDTRLFHCDTDLQCGEGFGCATGAPLTANFCARAPSECGASSCDGVCTQEGLCLQGCVIRDGQASACDTEGMTCVRGTLTGERGVCYPLATCTTSADCESTEICLSEVFQAFARAVPNAKLDHFYCVPRRQAGRCPEDYVPLLADPRVECYPRCTPEESLCPPAYGCATFYLDDVATPVCVPGFYGTACTDDASCLLGRCVESFGGLKVCTERCSDVERVPGNTCENLSSSDLFGAQRVFQCDRTRDLCVPKYFLGTPCNEAYRCVDGLQCVGFRNMDGTPLQLCTADCAADVDCNGGPTGPNFCRLFDTGGGYCFVRRPVGSACEAPSWCSSNVCEAGRCRERVTG